MHQSPDNELKYLRELARQNGVQTSFRDAFGQSRKATPEALMAVLRALGLRVTSPADAPGMLAEQEYERWHWNLAPVAVGWDGGDTHVDIRLPADTGGRVECRLTHESGAAYEWYEELFELPVRRRRNVRGTEYVARRLPVRGLPFGYHNLDLTIGSFQRTVTIIAAPRRTFVPEDDTRMWGIFAPLYALHSKEGRPIGTYTDLERFASWLHERGGRLVSTLPLTPTFLDEPYTPSPYSPVSRLFWNEFYIDEQRAAADSGSAQARAMLASPEAQDEIERIRNSQTVDYLGQMAFTRRIVSALADNAAGTPQGRAAEAYVEARPDVAEYARFRAVHERQGRPWPEWPEHLRDGQIADTDYDPAVYRYFLHAQWLAERQLAGASRELQSREQQLYLDLPTGCHGWGYDTWRYRGDFAPGIACGAPPDIVFTSGQVWGFPPLHPQAIRASGYDYFARVLQHHMKYADVLRIDHVMALHRLFWIPDGSSAADGVYVRYASEEMYAVLTLESHRNRVVIAGENLGTVPDYVNRALDSHGVFETYVMQYEVPWHEGEGIRTPPFNSVASLNTHDMPPFGGFLAGTDIGERRNLGMITDEWAGTEGHGRDVQRHNIARVMRDQGIMHNDSPDSAGLMQASTEFLARSPARYVLLNLEDLWLETEPQNIPGSPESAPELDHS